MLSISEIYLLPAGKGLPKSVLDLVSAQLKSELGKEGVKTALWNVINKVPEYGFDLLALLRGKEIILQNI
jgi:hypothetical protein